mgnify:CR=1 FL=1
MNDADFEGSAVLEKLAQIGERDSFFDAVDSDDFGKATVLLKKAGVDDATIKFVLRKMQEADGNH